MRDLSPKDATILAVVSENITKNQTSLGLKQLLSISDNSRYIKKIFETMKLIAAHRKIPRRLQRYSRAAHGLLKWAENNRTIHAPKRKLA